MIERLMIMSGVTGNEQQEYLFALFTLEIGVTTVKLLFREHFIQFKVHILLRNESQGEVLLCLELLLYMPY